MSRVLSAAAMEELLAQESGEAFIVLLEMSHPDFATTIRVNNSGQTLNSNGDDFLWYPFELILPEDSDGINSRAKLRIDNIDRSIVAAVRQIGTDAPVSCNFYIVMGSDPDTIEASFEGFKLVNVSYDVNVVEGDLTIEDFTSEPYPSGTMTPGLFPGLFG